MGVFNATGPADKLGIGPFLEITRQALGPDASFTWLDEDFLLAREVQPWSELPIWVPGEEGNIHTASIRRALAAGLTFRPLGDTVRATHDWMQAHPGQPPSDGTLTAEKESQILKEWHSRS
jgi:2'-hydroxyisoflavone reductase